MVKTVLIYPKCGQFFVCSVYNIGTDLINNHHNRYGLKNNL
ncbi:hypothetical protein SOHN41_02843 [Shewanella sp. HN-41]|nr:hypothetical protein SOHN41_02843 [Shewanella sp. HN-41]